MTKDSANKLLKKVALAALLAFVGGITKTVGSALTTYILPVITAWLD